jgi:hypothetical protein
MSSTVKLVVPVKFKFRARLDACIEALGNS